MPITLGTDLNDPDTRPWFLWDDPMTVEEVHRVLAEGSDEARTRLLARIMREARDIDVWVFTTPADVIREWEKLEPMLGRRRAFWSWLLGQWIERGLVDL
jgi:hypothetical protein